MRYVRVFGLYAYQHKGNRLEVVEPGSVVPMKDELADSFIRRGLGEEAEGPEVLIRPHREAAQSVERPGLDTRPSTADRAVARPQRG